MVLGAGQITNSFLVMPGCPYPLLANMKAYKPFSDEGAKLNNKDQKPIHVLVTSSLTKEYKLHRVATKHDSQPVR